MFTLDERLEADTHLVADLSLSRVLLMDNAFFSWVILVPQLPDLMELTDLTQAQQHQLMDEIATVSDALQTLTHAEKMNVAALGNMVKQLHIHIIARFEGDAAWPNPVWGTQSEPYKAQDRKDMIETLQNVLSAVS